MHGMDSIKRYTQQHIEYEPEWETSFNLSIKLQRSILSLIDWCSSDRIVYIECYKSLLHAISQTESSEDTQYKYKYDKIKFNGKSFEIIDYNIMREEVSIHAPLTRLFAAIFPQMTAFDLNFTSIRENLLAAKNSLSSSEYDPSSDKMITIVEPSIRAIALAIQTNVGLWKRNGFSLLSQVYFYNNIKCRQEMFDRDVLCLQIGASTMDPNEFIINLLNHFGLYDFFTNENYELPTPPVPSDTPSSQTPDEIKLEFMIPLSEEVLELLIYIISERYDTCISQIEPSMKLEREVIHQLCISPMAHSDLVKNIYPDNEKFSNELELVLNKIAVSK